MEGELPAEAPAAGEVQLRVERFALSTNNVTYATQGDKLGYWRAFPAPEGWGRIPAWGYARAVASRSEALGEGERVFGFVPTGGLFTVRPQAKPNGFVDAAPHRAGLATLYNRYLAVAGDEDDTALVMRPLFGTSLVLDMVLSEAGFHGAQAVVLTSASSKTSWGLAHLLRGREVQTIGLTSAPRRAWVERLHLYDRVLTYDDPDELSSPPGGAVLVDFAGDGELLRRVHERLEGALRRSILVGFTRWHAGDDERPLAGPAPEFFFAPTEIARRGRELRQRYPMAWQEFAPVAKRTLRIERVSSGEGLVGAYLELLEGRSDPAVGYVVSL